VTNDSGLWPSDGHQAVHFVGVGGVRMSAMAEMLARRGCVVSGSDRERSVFTEGLRQHGVVVAIGHGAENVGDVDAVVYTPAVGDENPELKAARERGIRVVEGKWLLGEMTRGKRLIAVAGTHGKTTTTAMITNICEKAALDPTSFVGGSVLGADSNLRVGGDAVWVVEADEYDRAFLELEPTVAVVTSLEADHLDLYGSEEEIIETFDRFLNGMADDGTAVVNESYRASADLTVPAGCERVSFGDASDADLRATDVTPDGLKNRFTATLNGRELGTITLRLPGRHNVANALSAIGAAHAIGAPWEAIQSGLETFQGVRRRFEVMYDSEGVVVVNDYAHHPTEISETLAAARSVWSGRVIAVFQPHLYSRTRDFADAFGQSLSAADVCWLTDIYPAREAPIPGVTAESLTALIPDCRYEPDLNTLAGSVVASVEPGDMILVMGAGSIDRVAAEISSALGDVEVGPN